MKHPLWMSLPVIAWLAQPASAVIVAGASGGGNTTTNTTQAQFQAEYGIDFPIYDNIIQYSDASGVYLGYNASTRDVWVLTARHVTTNATAGSTVTIEGQTYNRQPDGPNGYGILVGGDLRLVRYRHADLAVPSLQAVSISTTVPVASTALMMVGSGQNRTEIATTNGFISDATSTTSGTGYHWSGTRIKRWGTNNIEAEFLNAFETGTPVSGTTGIFSMGSYSTVGYMTDFDQPGTGQWLNSNEAQGSLGDSGGGAFYYSNGQWYLSGIFSAVAGFNGQDSSSSAFGNLTLLTDVATYSSSILSSMGGATLIPEPSAAVLSATGSLLFLLRRRRK